MVKLLYCLWFWFVIYGGEDCLFPGLFLFKICLKICQIVKVTIHPTSFVPDNFSFSFQFPVHRFIFNKTLKYI